MRRYIFRRILLFIPTFIVITLLSFIILVNAPGDPVERMLTASQSSGDISSQSIVEQEQRNYWTHYLGLDLPVFYFTIHSLAEPDSLYKISDRRERKRLEQLIVHYGNWSDVQKYYMAVRHLDDAFVIFSGDLKAENVGIDAYTRLLKERDLTYQLLVFVTEEKLEERISEVIKFISVDYHNEFGTLAPLAMDLSESFEQMKQHRSTWKNFVPVISFHPVNQYHRWLFGDGNTGNGILLGDFGISYLSKQSVSKIIGGRIGWSLFFTLVSVFLAYLISIPVAIRAASKKDSRFDRTSSLILFMLYSLPVFWVATLLMMTFCNTEVLNLFPASGIKPVTGYPPDAGLVERIGLSLPYLVLPTICYTYSSLAFLSRTLRVSMLEILSQDFIRTARAKGLPEKTVLWKHALKNSLLPVITVFANVFPFMIGGSVILETIFTIPGMGSAIYNSIDAQDYPMIVAVFTLTGILTMAGYLISDILYAVVDPRISFSKTVGA